MADEESLIEKKLESEEIFSEPKYKKFKWEEKPGYQKFSEGFKKFLYSDYYFMSIALCVVLFWLIGYYVKGVEVVGLIILILLASFELFFIDDVMPVIVMVFMAAGLFPHQVNPLDYGLVFLGFVPLPIAFIYHLIRYHGKLRLGKQFFPQLAISIALLLGGVGVIGAKDYADGLAYIMLLGVLILVLYFIFYNYSRPNKDVDLKRYFAKLCMYTAISIMVEVFIHYFQEFAILAQNPNYVLSTAVSIGWCIGNNFATELCLLIPGTCYLATKSKYSWAYMICLIFQYITIILSRSRGGMLFAFIALPFLFGFMLYSSKAYRKQMLIVAGTFLAIVAVGLIIAFAVKKDATVDFFRMFLIKSGKPNPEDVGKTPTLTGRGPIYLEACQFFKRAPIFGVGMGVKATAFTPPEAMPIYWFHSTFFHIIATMGLVGLAAYVYMYVIRYGFIIVKKDIFNILVFIGLLAFEGYSMIDTGTFIPMPTMIIVMFTTMFVEFINKMDNKEWQFEKGENGELVTIRFKKIRSYKEYRKDKEKEQDREIGNIRGRVLDNTEKIAINSEEKKNISQDKDKNSTKEKE